MTEDEKAVYDEEDPEVPVDLFSLWAKTEFADDEEEFDATIELADESAAPPLDADEMAYLTSADKAAASAEQETILEPVDDAVEVAEAVNDEQEAEPIAEIAEIADAEVESVETVDDEQQSELAAEIAEIADDITESAVAQEQIAETPAEPDELADDETETEPTAEIVETADDMTESAVAEQQVAEYPAALNEIIGDDLESIAMTEIANDESSEPAAPPLDDDEMAYLTSADNAAMSAEQEEPTDGEQHSELTAEIAEIADTEVEVAESVDDEQESEPTAEIVETADDMTESAVAEEQIAETPAESDELADDEAEAELTAEIAETADDMTESAVAEEQIAETPAKSDEIADDESSESAVPPLDDDEMAYLTSADNAAASAEQEVISEPAEAMTELAELADDEQQSELTAENVEIADDESSEPAAPPLDDDEMAYLTGADNAAVSVEQETDTAAAVAKGFADAASDITDDDLDDLIDVPILPLPAESTEVTDDDLAFIRAPILSPGDPVSMPSLAVQADPAVPPAELSSPSIVEIVQEQEAIESLGNLTAPKVTDPLALFKKLRDLAEELPHNVYYAFKASRMCATLDEIIADFES